MDVLGPLHKSNGKAYIIVATDNMTKWVETRSLSNATSTATDEFIVEQIIHRHGLLLSYRGTNFLAKSTQVVLKMLNIEHSKTTAYHAQCNGLVERYNGVLVDSLSAYTNAKQTD